MKINTANNTTSLIGSGLAGFTSGVLGEDGNIYGMPYNAAQVLKINTSTDIVSKFGTSPYTENAFPSSCLGIDNHIYASPHSALGVLKIDYMNNILSVVGSTSGLGQNIGMSLSANGSIYAPPTTASYVLRVNILQQSIEQIGAIAGASKYLGAVMGRDGNIYFIPHNATSVLEYKTGIAPVESDTYMPTILSDLPFSNYNKYYNKY